MFKSMKSFPVTVNGFVHIVHIPTKLIEEKGEEWVKEELQRAARALEGFL